MLTFFDLDVDESLDDEDDPPCTVSCDADLGDKKTTPIEWYLDLVLIIQM